MTPNFQAINLVYHLQYFLGAILKSCLHLIEQLKSEFFSNFLESQFLGINNRNIVAKKFLKPYQFLRIN